MTESLLPLAFVLRNETANYEFNLKWAEITTMGSAYLVVGAIASEMLEFSKTI